MLQFGVAPAVVVAQFLLEVGGDWVGRVELGVVVSCWVGVLRRLMRWRRAWVRSVWDWGRRVELLWRSLIRWMLMLSRRRRKLLLMLIHRGGFAEVSRSRLVIRSWLLLILLMVLMPAVGPLLILLVPAWLTTLVWCLPWLRLVILPCRILILLLIVWLSSILRSGLPLRLRSLIPIALLLALAWIVACLLPVRLTLKFLDLLLDIVELRLQSLEVILKWHVEAVC